MKASNFAGINLPNDYFILDYSQRQGLFHFDDEPNKLRGNDWVSLALMSCDDAMVFTEQFCKKHGKKDRRNQQHADLQTVTSELHTFFEKKNVVGMLAKELSNSPSCKQKQLKLSALFLRCKENQKITS